MEKSAVNEKSSVNVWNRLQPVIVRHFDSRENGIC